jgi:hypothetical protein
VKCGRTLAYLRISADHRREIAEAAGEGQVAGIMDR